jgi:fluoride exporter
VTIAALAVAGAFGALSRYALGGLVAGRAQGAFPWATFIVNVSGSLVLGFVFVLMTERFLPHPTLRTAVTIGFLSSYTTFSTFSLETLRLLEDGALGLAVTNVVASVAATLLAVYLGMVVARAL